MNNTSTKHQFMIVTTMYVVTALQLCKSTFGFTAQTALKRSSPSIIKNIVGKNVNNNLNKVLFMSTETDATEEAATTTALVNNRIPIGSLTSLDSRAIVDNLDLVISHLKSRRASDETIDAARQIAARNEERVALIKERDAALQTRNEQSAKIGMLMRNPDRDEGEVEEAKRLSNEAGEEATAAEGKLEVLEKEVSTLLSSIPNLLDDVTPDGDDENENEEVEVWGDIQSLPKKLGWPEDGSFEPLWHDDVAMKLNGWKGENAVAISGARFVALSGHIARLERALSSFFLDMHVTKHGYTEVSVPLVVGRSALEGTSQLPKFEEDLFKIAESSHQCNGQDAFLIPTAEVPLTNMHRESILEASELPISYVALTPCFRAEAGSYGRDTRGLIRTHQFSKVELVKITDKDTSIDQHEELTKHAQACLEALELPYRKVRLCSGDIGFSARHCYDLEVWLPGSQEFREISSCSNTGDFQAKRMNLRYRPEAKQVEESQKKGGKKKKAKKPKPEFCHTINGSGLAVGRALVAVLENYQMPDGSLVVPEVLRPYLGGAEVLK